MAVVISSPANDVVRPPSPSHETQAILDNPTVPRLASIVTGGARGLGITLVAALLEGRIQCVLPRYPVWTFAERIGPMRQG
ncbi:short chain [Moniliophthora roreri]|uniref:Uncharacterized protein n=1 Tax=Moniliophthora roreri TaxID=221103 RepID=A0A0W0FF23_MONRR|nr:short chain [Moniliophthora roreri]